MSAGHDPRSASERTEQLFKLRDECDRLIREAGDYLAGTVHGLPLDFDERVRFALNETARRTGFHGPLGGFAMLSVFDGALGSPMISPSLHEEFTRTVSKLRARRDAISEVLAPPASAVAKLAQQDHAEAGESDPFRALQSLTNQTSVTFARLLDAIRSAAKESGRPHGASFVRKAVRSARTSIGNYDPRVAIPAYIEAAKKSATKAYKSPQGNATHHNAIRDRATSRR